MGLKSKLHDLKLKYKGKKMAPAFNALHTFLYSPDETTHSGSHVRVADDLKRTMNTVIMALVPCLLFGMFNAGYQHYSAINGFPADFSLMDHFLTWDNFALGAITILPLLIVSYGVGLGIEFLNEKQVVQFTINSAGFQWVNPKTEIKVVLLQNYYWPSAIYGIKPQFTLGNELVYKYDKETSFYGGNEFLYFDTSDLRAPSAAISKIEYRDLYHHILFTDLPRNDQPYTYFPDITLRSVFSAELVNAFEVRIKIYQ